MYKECGGSSVISLELSSFNDFTTVDIHCISYLSSETINAPALGTRKPLQREEGSVSA
jgi:hypothetical protein